MRNFSFIVLTCAFCGLYLTTLSQTHDDSSFRQKAINSIVSYYHESIGLQAHLYNGPQYEPYPRPFTSGHQYFNVDSLVNGFVSYDGLGYHNIPMRYDLIRDEVTIFHPNGYLVNLVKEKLDSFTIFDRSFIRLENIKLPGSVDAVGYYEQVYSSPTISFLAKRVKTTQETTGRMILETTVYSRSFYYIFKDGAYYIIRNKKSFLELLKNKKAQTQQYIKSNKLRFKSFEQDVLQTVRYYDQLK